MFAIEVHNGEPLILCYSNWEELPHTGNLRVSSAISYFHQALKSNLVISSYLCQQILPLHCLMVKEHESPRFIHIPSRGSDSIIKGIPQQKVMPDELTDSPYK